MKLIKTALLTPAIFIAIILVVDFLKELERGIHSYLGQNLNIALGVIILTSISIFISWMIVYGNEHD